LTEGAAARWKPQRWKPQRWKPQHSDGGALDAYLLRIVRRPLLSHGEEVRFGRAAPGRDATDPGAG
jgi:hypothetical protein